MITAERILEIERIEVGALSKADAMIALAQIDEMPETTLEELETKCDFVAVVQSKFNRSLHFPAWQEANNRKARLEKAIFAITG